MPFDDTDEPTYLVDQIGSFSLVSAAGAPADSPLLGSGKDDDLYLYCQGTLRPYGS